MNAKKKVRMWTRVAKVAALFLLGKKATTVNENPNKFIPYSMLRANTSSRLESLKTTKRELKMVATLTRVIRPSIKMNQATK